MEEHLPHKLTLSDGSRLTVTAVTEVAAFDDTAALLRTPLGDLVIQGENLQLKTLSSEGGQTVIEGTVTAMFYEQTKKSGFFRRLVK